MIWLIERTIAFPKSQRGVVARRIQENLFTNHQLLIQAGRSRMPLAQLEEFDTGLAELRSLLQISRDLKLLSIGQFEHVTRLVDEIGRLLGGWLKKVRSE